MKQAVLDTDILSYITDERYQEVFARAHQSMIDVGCPLEFENWRDA
jgi:hypothetical protein